MAAPHPLPPRLDLGDVILRRFRTEDAEELRDAVAASYDELHPWMPWASAPPNLEDQREFIDRMSQWPSPGGSFAYGIFSAGKVSGVVGIEDRVGPGALEIGYWRRTGAGGRGIVTRAAGAVTAECLRLPAIGRVEIHCDASNMASAAVARRLGYRLDRLESRQPSAPSESDVMQIWVAETAPPHVPA
ncbi:GNAT family N-acetyltransferase [Tsukamurella sp. 8F]|uniref:GNAT family N-acetyltransferase n=1 Tax=unclassified Tsukamurella TaxID=2633480 RepID=UPI0023B8D4CB|nr:MULTISPECIES: GNAT family N-acetyltransferase [unclassified Tsukamurella]MDF0531050.1 GNAT family N-acetyltransferase [Tsukamurella sp. 8J]MDF0585483.1 GNAT family N-acetyltransferase [Tsukamurella sp. 8F]